MQARETKCETCGKVNRVRGYSIFVHPVCGRCGAPLAERRGALALRSAYRNRFWLAGGFAIVVIAAAAWIGSKVNPYSDTAAWSARPPCTVLARPENGTYWAYSTGPRVSPLKIITSTGGNYFVKFEDAATHAPVIAFFIYGSSILDADMPAGTFVVKYAVGDEWCGPADLFGRSTWANWAPTPLTFRVDDGHTLQLWRQAGGNMRVREISPSDF